MKSQIITDRDFRLDQTGRVVRARVGKAALGSVQSFLAYGTWGAGVLTVVVSNDPNGNVFENHPDAITLTSATRITSPFRIGGYLWYGARVSTVNATEAIAEVSLRPAG